MQEWDLKGVGVLLLEVSTQVILRRHLVAQVPIILPSSAHWVPRRVINGNVLFLAESIGTRNIANKVMEVETLNVPGVLGSDLFDTVLTICGRMEVNTIEATDKFSTNVLQIKVFIHCNEAPVGDLDRLCRLLED